MGSPTVTPKVEGLNISDIIKLLFDKNYCLETLTFDTGSYVVGQILVPGLVADKREIQAVGEADADSVCLEKVTSVDNAGVGLVLVRGPAIVDGDLLTYLGASDNGENAALLDEEILVKDNVTA